MNLSENFTLYELIYSITANANGINNTPSKESIKNLQALCQNVLQPLRWHLGVPIIITSGYRCPVLNKKIGGVPTSQHIIGQAADFITPRKDLKISFDYIKNYLDFDQLLYEHAKDGTTWIHVSYKAEGHNRRQAIENYIV